jgi:hypothetical protein
MKLRLTVGALALLVFAAPQALAAMATAEQITAAVSDNTIQGNMDSSGPYAEYYAADGTVFGKDYKAKWSVEGDTMCWVYEGTPKDCWGVEIEGDQVRWVKDGKAQGSGTVLKGNTNNFK